MYSLLAFLVACENDIVPLSKNGLLKLINATIVSYTLLFIYISCTFN